MLGPRSTRVVALAAALFGFCMACAAAEGNDDGQFTASQLACHENLRGPTFTFRLPVDQATPPQGVVVRVSLQFPDPEGAPAVTLISNSGTTDFADIVKQRLAAFRLDCLPKDGAPSALVGEVQFIPGPPPKVVEAWRVARTPSANVADCYKGIDGAVLLPFNPPGGSAIRVKDEHGIVIAEWVFRGPDSPPSMTVLFSNAGPKFESSVLEHGASYRRPCQREGAKPTVVHRVFILHPPDAQSGAVPLSLQQFLGSLDALRERPVRLDFTTMGCPFKTRFTYYQPYTTNDIDEATAGDANKREFVEWLAASRVKPALNSANRLIGRSFDIDVPCLVLDLL